MTIRWKGLKWRSRQVASPVKALIVVGACYAGSRLFLKLNFTEAGPAIFFPPYAVLTAALLFSNVRQWWMYLLAASAGKFIGQQMAFPLPHALLTEIANYAKAGIAAYGIQRFSAGRLRLDRLDSMVAFLSFAVAFGPLCAAFIGAGSAVAFNGAQDYWLAWRAWFLSNAVTALVLLPLIITLFTHTPERPTVWPAGRIVEATTLAVLLLLIALPMFTSADSGGGGFSARFYAPLPLLVWAALRFGLAGTSASLLLLTSAIVWEALAGRGPFADRSPAENLLELQVFIIAMSFSLMLLSAVVEERRHKEVALRQSEAKLRQSYEQVQNLHDTQRQLAGSLLRAQDDERRRIARDLHDVTAQNLAALKANLLTSRAGNRTAGHSESLGEAASLCDQVITELRTLSYLLHPPILDEAGLVEALQLYVRGFRQRSGIAVEILVLQNIGRLSTEVEMALFRVVQESLTNVHRHSGSRTAIVWIMVEAGEVVVRIKDEGAGIMPKSTEGHREGELGVGILGMQERLRQLGGRLDIASASNGTTVTAIMPIEGKSHAAHSGR